MKALIPELEAVADWRAGLASRIARLKLRFEFAGVGELERLAEDQDAIDREVAEFKTVCQGIAKLMKE
jgi:hypothetical protein